MKNKIIALLLSAFCINVAPPEISEENVTDTGASSSSQAASEVPATIVLEGAIGRNIEVRFNGPAGMKEDLVLKILADMTPQDAIKLIRGTLCKRLECTDDMLNLLSGTTKVRAGNIRDLITLHGDKCILTALKRATTRLEDLQARVSDLQGHSKLLIFMRNLYEHSVSFVLDDTVNLCLSVDNHNHSRPVYNDEFEFMQMLMEGNHIIRIKNNTDHPPYSVESNIGSDYQRLPGYFIGLFDMLKVMETVHSSPSDARFLYDSGLHERMKSMYDIASFTIKTALDDGSVLNLVLGKLYLSGPNGRHDILKEDLVQKYVNEGNVIQLIVIIKQAYQCIRFEFDGFSPQQKCAFLNWAVTELSEQLLNFSDHVIFSRA